MKQKRVNGLHISSLTLGTVQLGMDYGIANKNGMPNQDTSFSILQSAVKKGVLSFDTAHAYGESEKVLGRFFGNQSNPIFITKLRIEVDCHTKSVDLERQVYNSVEKSLSNLGVKRLPVLLLHNLGILENHGNFITSVFQKLQLEGYVDKIGASFDSNINEQFRTIWDTIKDDLYEVVQVPTNIFDHRLFHNGGFQKLQETQKIVFGRSVFLQGLLFLKEDELPYHLKEASEALHILQNISKKSGLSIPQLAVSFIRDLNYIHSLVIGVETLSQLTSTIELMEGPVLSEEVRKECMERLACVPEKIVNTKFWKS